MVILGRYGLKLAKEAHNGPIALSRTTLNCCPHYKRIMGSNSGKEAVLGSNIKKQCRMSRDPPMLPVMPSKHGRQCNMERTVQYCSYLSSFVLFAPVLPSY